MTKWWAASLGAVGFADHPNGNYRLGANSPYKGTATHGGDPGADFDVLEYQTRGAISGEWE